MIKFEGEKVIEIDREAEEVSIPPTATRICKLACFFGSITSLDLENSNVIIIEKHAFANCLKLKEIRFPQCLEEICEGAFKQCKLLKYLSFPLESKLIKIGHRAFKGCQKLKIFDIPRLLEFIGDYSFDECWKLKILDLRDTKMRHIGRTYFEKVNIYLPSTVTPADIIRISEECDECHIEVDESHQVVQRDSCGYFFSNGTIFHGNQELRRVLIRRGVERIAGNCFNRSRIVSVTIPSSVIVISDHAFDRCERLRHIRFTKDSLLQVIGKEAFYCSIKKIHFPKSLQIIKIEAFYCCQSLERVVFPQDSQLERIEGAFKETAIKRLSLPLSVREIVDVSYGMWKLESMFVSNEYYQSNEEGSAIFSKDGSELVCVIKTLGHFEIPDCVRVIKKRAFYDSLIKGRLIIPTSVEVIEEEAFKFCYNLKIIEFEEGSRLKSLAFNALFKLRDLIINNENFVTMESGVVMSIHPSGIVFVPKHLTELDIPPGVGVICSHAFYESKIESLKLPKSLKKICSNAFQFSYLEIITFEEGTELEFIENFAFNNTDIKSLQLPHINGDLDENSLVFYKIIEFPPNLHLKSKELNIYAGKIICPLSSLLAISCFNISENHSKLVILNK